MAEQPDAFELDGYLWQCLMLADTRFAHISTSWAISQLTTDLPGCRTSIPFATTTATGSCCC